MPPLLTKAMHANHKHAHPAALPAGKKGVKQQLSNYKGKGVS